MKKYDHVTPIIKDPQWLAVKDKYTFEECITVFFFFSFFTHCLWHLQAIMGTYWISPAHFWCRHLMFFYIMAAILAHVVPSELPSHEDTKAVGYGKHEGNFKPLGK